jgi:hypothetical protein
MKNAIPLSTAETMDALAYHRNHTRHISPQVSQTCRPVFAGFHGFQRWTPLEKLQSLVLCFPPSDTSLLQ